MIFNSTTFLVFFAIVYVLYWLANKHLKLQNVLLLLASYVFYGWWDWRFLSLIFISSLIDYYAAQKMEQKPEQSKRWLMVSLVCNLGMLSLFKYYNFFASSFTDMTRMFGWEPNDLTLNIILPVGISFYTFQTLSYTIDVYRKNLKPTKDLLAFLTYIAFFPQLVAGPIERASSLLIQIEKKRVFRKDWFNEGIVQIFVGLFRKVVIADTLGIYVDAVYGDIGINNSASILLATVLYAFQIYYDFAGYSDIAIGTAKMMGFRFCQNFNLPYFSKSLTEFWRKWHMSLSYWLRDYLYISLGGNRKGIKITYRNLMLTMLLGGLWHGSSWNFIIWGGIHGLFLSIEKYTMNKSWFTAIRKWSLPAYVYTFGVVVFSWIFFRAQSLDMAFTAISKIIHFEWVMPYFEDINIMVNTVTVLGMGLLIDFYLFKKNLPLETLGAGYSPLKISIIISLLLVLISLFYSTSNNFIYFQF
ncbi:MAG: MBOAT family protein [Saprospiraceae bacterium]|jgi:alginate O-acetyltransferase complex protein AlgI|nr:MBOAT family protein [Saprospiraceae bacterium]